MEIGLEEIARYMRMGPNVPEGALRERVVELRAAALKTVRPARCWRRFAICAGAIAEGAIRLEISGSLARHIAGCREAYLVCATIGAAFDTFQRGVSCASGVDALVAQATGAALIEKLMDDTEDEIRRELAPGETLLRRYSPGYGTFPLSAQRELFALLDAGAQAGVYLTDALTMVPTKSVSAIIGVLKRDDSGAAAKAI